MKKHKNFVLVNSQVEKLELHVAFYGNDNEDQILCEMMESAVIELTEKAIKGLLPTGLEIDGDVKDYIREKYLD